MLCKSMATFSVGLQFYYYFWFLLHNGSRSACVPKESFVLQVVKGSPVVLYKLGSKLRVIMDSLESREKICIIY